MSHTASVLLAICIGVSFPAATLAVSATLQQRLIGRNNGSHRVQLGSTGRIINGTEVTDQSASYSFFALPTSSQNSNEWLGCGASIISPTWGVTASHCFGGGDEPCKGPKKISLWVGDLHLDESGSISGKTGAGMKSAKVHAEITCHPQFDGKCAHGHDITLLKLTDALPDWVTPVPLNLDGHGTESVGELTVNIGFGYREEVGNVGTISPNAPSTMRKALLTIYGEDYAACASVYAGGYGCSDTQSETPNGATNKAQQLCAGATDEPERDTCSGDSGSPMLDQNGVQIGIVSYGGGPGTKMSGPGRICADPAYMGVYSRISAFSDFIRQHVTDLPQDATSGR